MLAIARMLRTGVRMLLLDEPTEGLAPVIIDRIGEVLADLKARGMTILLVEQNFRFASRIADRFYVMEGGAIVAGFPVGELAGADAVAARSAGGLRHDDGLRRPGAGAAGAAPGGADQRVVLRDAEPGARDHLRDAPDHQLRPRRALHAGRLHRLPDAGASRHRLLAGAGAGAAGRGALRRHRRAAGAEPALQRRSALRPALHLRAGAGDRGDVPLLVRGFGQPVPDAGGARGRHEPRLHVPAGLPRLGGGGLAGGLHRDVAPDREDPARRHPARVDRERHAWCRRSASTCRCS